MAGMNAVITGVGAYVPEYRLTNEELSRMVDTNDEWIMTRVGIKERRILKGKNENGGDLGASDMAVLAIKDLVKKTGLNLDEVDLLVCTTVTPDAPVPSTAAIIGGKLEMHKALSFDVNGACSGFLYGLDLVSQYIKAGSKKKAILVSTEKMSSIVDYTDRTTCVLFGDAATAVLVEPTEENVGVLDSDLHTDGFGREWLKIPAGGSVMPASHETVDGHKHFIYQEGKQVFRYAVTYMADATVDVMKRNNLKAEDIAWLVPHQANLRIISATAERMELPAEKVMINIERYGNTTSATIPLCLYEWEKQLKKGDNLILAAFGAGFTWGAMYIKWGY
ncbi:MAG: ketoacyl-ACP synthase III [Bacteroidales bacterium]|nr:ketoacyl-ACP synthase III [Bacteroidales bacterium]